MLGLMKRHLAMAGKAVGGAGLTGTVLYLVATAPTHVHVYWPYWLFLVAVLVGVGLYFIGQERSPAVAVAIPSDAQVVPQAMTASGSATRIPDNMTLWLIVQAGHSFYPQTKIHLAPDGRWFELVHFGRIDGSVDHRFTLYVVGADPEANGKLEIYKQQSARKDTAPLSEAKGTYPNVTTYAAVNVIRGVLFLYLLLPAKFATNRVSQNSVRRATTVTILMHVSPVACLCAAAPRVDVLTCREVWMIAWRACCRPTRPPFRSVGSLPCKPAS